MKNYIERVEKEKKKLDKKISKLSVFVLSETYMTFDSNTRDLFTYQLNDMNSYSRRLRDRLIRMKKDT